MTLGLVYVLTNPAMPELVKIGMTSGLDAKSRIDQLYGSGVPFPFAVAFACRVDNPAEVERALHIAFAPQRVNPRREFFKIDPAQAIAILRLLHVEDATADVNAAATEITQAEEAAGDAYAARRPNLNFEEMGIPVGSVLVATMNGQEAIVTGARRVTLAGREMSLTEATRAVLGIDYSVAPTPHWSYAGRSLKEIYDATYASE